MKKKYTHTLTIILLLFFTIGTNAQVTNCTVNAGGNATVCGSSTTLTGSTSGNVFADPPTWTFVSGPVTPVIASPNAMTTNVTGMTADGNYTFQISQRCETGTATSLVVITAHPRPATFTTGPDILNICATVGTTPLSGVIPAGFVGTWRAVNIWSYHRFNSTVNTNAQFSSTTIANPTFSLINNANHEIDPAYWAILRITSADGICSYEDTTVVRFIPNPNINPPLSTSRCLIGSGTPGHYIFLTAPPYFNTNYPDVAGSVTAGTTVSINVITQPAGATMSFNRLDDNNILHFNGVTQTGTYTFTVTVTNSCGTYTSPTLTYIFEGTTPKFVNFQPTGHGSPEQLVIYYTVASGGEVHCNLAGTNTPEHFYFSVDPTDPPTVLTTVTPSGVIPPDGSPAVSVTGAGTYNREALVTPPSGGWRVGTYRFNINTRNADGSCGINQTYVIHISDNSRPDVEVPDVNVCYPGTGAISATITLPNVYKGVVNSSYFQDFSGHYNIQLVSSPAGAATPTYTTTNLRSLTSSTTNISNLNKVGDYFFKITPVPYTGSVGPFLDQEYACSGTSMVDTFMVRVEGLVNSNAGSDQVLGNVTTATLTGNDPGLASGVWSVAETPVGASPNIANINNANTTVSNLTVPGSYKFAWTITTPFGGCVSADTVMISVSPVLSVKWLYFHTERNTDGVVLNWATASEANNKGFDVERSSNSIQWEKIGFIASNSLNGNSNQELVYYFTDHLPKSGTNFYRLKQVDLDGKYEYSIISKISSNDLEKLQFYPNPVSSVLVITGLNNPTRIQLLNSNGQVIKLVTVTSTPTVQIDMSKFPSGLYMIKAIDNTGRNTHYKIIKK